MLGALPIAAAAAVTALPVCRRELAPLVTGYGALGIASLGIASLGIASLGIASLGLATAAAGFAYAAVPTAPGCSAASSTRR